MQRRGVDDRVAPAKECGVCRRVLELVWPR
jgi:hypothetical protein